jgi:hypothetical protein
MSIAACPEMTSGLAVTRGGCVWVGNGQRSGEGYICDRVLRQVIVMLWPGRRRGNSDLRSGHLRVVPRTPLLSAVTVDG